MTTRQRQHRSRTHCTVRTYQFSPYGNFCEERVSYGTHTGPHKTKFPQFEWKNNNEAMKQ